MDGMSGAGLSGKKSLAARRDKGSGWAIRDRGGTASCKCCDGWMQTVAGI